MATKRKASKRAKTTKKASSAKKSKAFKRSGKLVRSKSDKMITGVIGGIAHYLGIDSTILRLLWIAIVAFTGFVPGVIAYGLASVIIPEK